MDRPSFEANLIALQAEHVKPSSLVKMLEPLQIIEVMEALGVRRYQENSNYLVFPTVCHNVVGEGSMKLYYYYDNKRFVCYTGCEHAMSIIDVVQKVRRCSLYEAVHFITTHCSWEYVPHESEEELSSYDFPVTAKPRGLQELTPIDPYILQSYRPVLPQAWADEGMSEDARKAFDVRYSLWRNAAIIPHKNYHGEPVGIRVRNFNWVKGDHNGKYEPLWAEGRLYNHSLAHNLYGLWENREAIRLKRTVVVGEGEKFALLHRTYFGDYSNAVAVCGSKFQSTHLDLIMKVAAPREILVAFDKEYIDPLSTQADDYYKKLTAMFEPFLLYTNVSLIMDWGDLLQYKDSPIDRGPDVFQQLYTKRTKIRR